MGRQYKILRQGQSGQTQSLLSIPREIAQLLPDEVRFEVELTDDGILYRPVKHVPAPKVVPAWVSELNPNREVT